MFIYQGQKSFYLWNKVNPTIDTFIRVKMIKIGIIHFSGRQLVKLFQRKRPLFIADDVEKILPKKNFRKLLANKLNIVLNKSLKNK